MSYGSQSPCVRHAGERQATITGFYAVAGAFTLISVLIAGLAIFVALCASGCSPQTRAADEATIGRALTKIDSGLTWAASNAPAITAAISDAAALDPNDAALQKVATKATAAVAAGDLVTAQAIVHSGATIYTGLVALPSPAPSPGAPSPGAPSPGAQP